MSAPRQRPQILLRPVCVDRETAAAALGVGMTVFAERVQPELAVIRIGTKVLVPVRELERWAERNAAAVLPERG